jgi:NAD(P)-dependent dehydrogenase (short-subunit alcohol dehydrogenase family)
MSSEYESNPEMKLDGQVAIVTVAAKGRGRVTAGGMAKAIYEFP